MDQLLRDIDRFRRKFGVSDTRFGQLALNDRAFVHRLRGGRECLPSTEAKVRDFMAGYASNASQVAA